MDKVFDVTNEDEILKKVDLFMHGLNEGLHALAIDFGFHIDDAWNNKKIFELSHSIRYRLFSSRFHFRLLFTQLEAFRKKHQALIHSPSPPILHLEIDKKEHSSLMDSIIFHISSVLDYASTLTNYIISKNPKNVKWGSIVKSARDNSNIFSHKNEEEMKKTINEIDSGFGNALYVYRSELIHNSDDVCNYNHSWNLMSGKVSVVFFCSKKVLRHFKKMGEKDDMYSITYFAQFTIFETIDSIRRIILSLRKYLADNLKEENFVVSNKNPLIYFDKDGNKLGAASIYHWREFDSIFNTSP